MDENGQDVYNAQLTDVDLQNGQNRYYHIQLLRHKEGGLAAFGTCPLWPYKDLKGAGSAC